MLLSLFSTSHHNTLCLDDIFQADEESFNKWVDHREDHPDVDQLYVRSAWKRLADPMLDWSPGASPPGLDLAGYQKWHLGCPNQNSKTTFQ